MRCAFLLAALCLVSAAPLLAQQTSVPLSVMGRVNSAWAIEPVNASSNDSAVVFRGNDARSLLVEVSPRGETSAIKLMLAVRTNAHSFRVRMERWSCANPVRVSTGTPAPSGGGTLVNPAYASSFVGVSDASLEAPMFVASGPRVSLGGRFSSSENALLIPITLKLENPSSVSCTLLLAISE